MNKVLLITVLFFSVLSFGQKSEFDLIELDSTWGKEVLRFPARNMDYIGVGEVRFPPKGWINPKHTNFWSYTYAWKIDIERGIPAKELELDLVKYFNSLNRINMNETSNTKYSTAKVAFIKKEKETTFFKGSVTIFDRFATKKMLTLTVLIESRYCKKKKKTILLFRFSPKKRNHKVWNTLRNIKLLPHLCD